jgi:hypothetical protein
MTEETKVNIVINRETAIDDFQRWANRWKVGRKMRNAKEEDKEEFEEKKYQVIDLIEDGFLMYDDDKDCLVYTFQFPGKARNLKSIEINRPSGSALMGSDKYQEKQAMHKSISFLANMTGKEVAFFSGLDYLDLEPLTMVMNLFLAS